MINIDDRQPSARTRLRGDRELTARPGRTRLHGRWMAAALVAFGFFQPVATRAAEAAPGVGTGGVLKALLALAAVLVAVLAIAWVARRISPTNLAGSALKLQGGLSVGTRERVMLVEIKDTWLVLGVAPGRVNLLHTLPRPEDSHATANSTPSNNGNFATWLSNAMKRQSNA